MMKKAKSRSRKADTHQNLPRAARDTTRGCQVRRCLVLVTREIGKVKGKLGDKMDVKSKLSPAPKHTIFSLLVKAWRLYLITNACSVPQSHPKVG